jgi:lysophospholipase L1-like esterase
MKNYSLILLAVSVLFAAGGADAAAKAAAPFAKGERVTMLGDSITHGGKYCANLQLFWDLRFPGSGVRLMNCGVSGGTAAGALDRWQRDVLKQDADRIFVINDGGIAEQGSPKELLEKKGAYYKLYMAQFGEV